MEGESLKGRREGNEGRSGRGLGIALTLDSKRRGTAAGKLMGERDGLDLVGYLSGLMGERDGLDLVGDLLGLMGEKDKIDSRVHG